MTLPGGVRQGFTFTPELRTIGSVLGSLTFAVPRFTPDRGVTTRLSVRGGTLLVNEFGELMDGSGQPYNPAAEQFGGGYTLTTPDGIAYRVDGATGLLTSATDRNHNVIDFSDAGISGSGVNLTFERDARGRITRVIDPQGNSVQYGYDTRGDLVRVTARDDHATRFEYRVDRPHFLDKVIDPLGRTGMRTEYGPDGRLTGVLDLQGHAVEYRYDPGNSLVTTTDRLGHASVIGYDAQGNVVLSVDALGNTTRFSYDELGNLASRTDALGNTTRWTHDAAGRVLNETDALGHTTFTTYGAYGTPVSYTSAGGQTWTLTLDDRGNPTGSIDPLGNTQQYVLDERGSPVRVRDARGEETALAYDSAGRLVQSTSALGELLQYAYDLTGNFMSQASAGAQPVSFSYSASGAVTSVTTAGQTTQLITDAAGRLTGGGIGTAVGTVAYDGGDRVQSLTLADGTRVDYEYDAAQRVVAERSFDAASLLTGQTTYYYNAAGDLVSRAGTLGSATFVYSSGGQLLSGDGKTYTYDSAGNVATVTESSGAVTTLAFDARGRLVRVQRTGDPATTFEYDSQGNRVAATTDTTRTAYWIDRQSGELARVLRAETGSDTVQYVHQGYVEQEIVNGVPAYIHRDALGSTRLMTDSAGQPVAQLSYSAFGQTTQASGTPGVFRFAGEQFDQATGLYYLRARYYDPTTGRFASRDPAQTDSFTPDGFAGYQYARNNPVNFTDPSGRLTLAETLTVVRERLQQYQTDILRYKKSLDTVTTRIGEVAQFVGGAMAAVAVFYPPHNISWAVYTFGPKFFSGMINTFDIGRDMLGGAQASYEISFGLNTATGKTAVAYYNRTVSEAQHSLGNRRFARFGLAPTFPFLGLGGAIRPMVPIGGLFGEPSMGGIMVHEFSHFSLDTKDADYGCTNVAHARPNRGLASKVFTSDETLKNADNYRCYARAVTLAFERLAAEIL